MASVVCMGISAGCLSAATPSKVSGSVATAIASCFFYFSSMCFQCYQMRQINDINVSGPLAGAEILQELSYLPETPLESRVLQRRLELFLSVQDPSKIKDAGEIVAKFKEDEGLLNAHLWITYGENDLSTIHLSEAALTALSEATPPPDSIRAAFFEC